MRTHKMYNSFLFIIAKHKTVLLSIKSINPQFLAQFLDFWTLRSDSVFKICSNRDPIYYQRWDPDPGKTYPASKPWKNALKRSNWQITWEAIIKQPII